MQSNMATLHMAGKQPSSWQGSNPPHGREATLHMAGQQPFTEGHLFPHHCSENLSMLSMAGWKGGCIAYGMGVLGFTILCGSMGHQWEYGVGGAKPDCRI